MDTIERQLRSIHLVTGLEAISLGCAVGLNPVQIYNICSGSAAQSWSFNNTIIPFLGTTDGTDGDLPLSLDTALGDLQDVLKAARDKMMFTPLTSAAEQTLLAAKARGGLKPFYKSLGIQGLDCTSFAPRKLEQSDAQRPAVGFVGLGAMGQGMAAVLVKAGFKVAGYDVYAPSVEKFAAAGGTPSASPAEAARAADVLLLMCATPEQADAILFGEGGAAAALAPGSAVLICSTVPPSYVLDVRSKLPSSVDLVDAPVSGGTARAANGDLSVMCSGDELALGKCAPVIRAISGKDENVFVVDGGLGGGQKAKMVNQVLAGTHLCAAAEALALSVALGLDAKAVYEKIPETQGSSFMWTNRGAHMVSGDWTPHSKTDIFVKDMSIVVGESRKIGYPAPMSAVAQQLFILASKSGFANEDDASVVRIWEKTVGIVTVQKS